MVSHAELREAMLCVEGKHSLHNIAGVEKQAENKTATKTQAVLWQPQNKNLHIKRKN
jgi:hypothetical protein